MAIYVTNVNPERIGRTVRRRVIPPQRRPLGQSSEDTPSVLSPVQQPETEGLIYSMELGAAALGF